MFASIFVHFLLFLLIFASNRPFSFLVGPFNMLVNFPCLSDSEPVIMLASHWMCLHIIWCYWSLVDISHSGADVWPV